MVLLIYFILPFFMSLLLLSTKTQGISKLAIVFVENEDVQKAFERANK